MPEPDESSPPPIAANHREMLVEVVLRPDLATDLLAQAAQLLAYLELYWQPRPTHVGEGHARIDRWLKDFRELIDA